MTQFKVLAIGDSVVWGEGLQPEQKFHYISANRIADSVAKNKRLVLTHKAHSGAVLNEPVTSARLRTDVLHWQEVPNSAPTIMEQLTADESHPESTDDSVDLVILNGGINDINFREILNPLADERQLEYDIKNHCYYDMKKLLGKTRRFYPNAVIIVVGYFPILSEESRLDILQVVISLLTLITLSLTTPLVSVALAKRVARRSRYFHRKQLSWLRRAVLEFHENANTRGPGVLFAHPAFGPQNCVGAPQALLFGPKPAADIEDAWKRFLRDPLTNILLLEPDDPMSRERRSACEILRDGLNLVQCRIGALGHPNPAGARQYADIIYSKYLQNRRIHLRQMLGKILIGGRKLSLREAIMRHGFETAKPSVRDYSQYMIIDCIDVTIKTKDESLAGTDHDVFFRVHAGRAWKLSESVFDGDLFDDFEKGKTTTYTIDPAEGRPGERLHIWEIREISLILQFNIEGVLSDDLTGFWKPDWIRVALNGRMVIDAKVNKALTITDPIWTLPDYPR